MIYTRRGSEAGGSDGTSSRRSSGGSGRGLAAVLVVGGGASRGDNVGKGLLKRLGKSRGGGGELLGTDIRSCLHTVTRDTVDKNNLRSSAAPDDL